MADTQPPPVTADGFLTDSWYLAAPSAALKPGEQQRIMMLGEPVVVGRTPAGEAFALRDICPHRLVPLSAGRQIETEGAWTLQCPYHGWRFGTDGVCKLMPSLTDDTPYDAQKVRVRRYPVHETKGAMFVFVAEDPRSSAEPATRPPDLGALPDKPVLVRQGKAGLHIDKVAAQLRDLPALTPAASRRLRGLLGGNTRAEMQLEQPLYRWDICSGRSGRLSMLTCLTPETPQNTMITELTWWTGPPFLHLAVPFLFGQRRPRLLAGFQPDGKPALHVKSA